MSVANFIDEENITLVQGIDGICLCEESWMKPSEKSYIATLAEERAAADNNEE